MNDTKVVRYSLGHEGMTATDWGEWITHDDHARIVAMMRQVISDQAEGLVELVMLKALIAKYQRLHAADVAWDKANYDYHINGVENYDEIERTAEMRRLAMEALK